MVKWASILEELRIKWRELATVCGCADDEAYQEVSRLTHEETCPPLRLDRCCSCMLKEILETKSLIQVPLSSLTYVTMVYVLEDSLVEISDDCGTIAGAKCFDDLIESLKDLGYDTNVLEEVLKTLHRSNQL